MKRKERPRHHVMDWLGAALFATLARAIQALPWRPAIALGKGLGWCVWMLGGKRPRRVLNQMRLILGDRTTEEERRRLARLSYLHFGVSAIEIIKMPQVRREHLDTFFSREDVEALLDATGREGGAILAASHLGAYPWGAQMLAQVRPGGVAALHREIDNPRAERILAGLRTAGGLELISKFASFLEVRKAVNAGKVVCLIIDQDGGKRGIFSDFLGYPASTWTSVAEAHLLLKVPLVVASMWREGFGPRQHLRVHEVVRWEGPPDGLDKEARRAWHHERVRELTDRVNARLGEAILARPEQWLWVHRRWKSRPKGDPTPVVDGVPCPWLLEGGVLPASPAQEPDAPRTS